MGRVLRSLEIPVHILRNQRALLDRDVAEFYGVSLAAFQAELRRRSSAVMRGMIIRLREGERRRFGNGAGRPVFALTSAGAALASSFFGTPAAMRTAVCVARDFIRYRRQLYSYPDVELKLESVASRRKSTDEDLLYLLSFVQGLMAPSGSRSGRVRAGAAQDMSTRVPTA